MYIKISQIDQSMFLSCNELVDNYSLNCIYTPYRG